MKTKLGRPPKYKTPPQRLNILMPKALYQALRSHVEAKGKESISEFVQKSVSIQLKVESAG